VVVLAVKMEIVKVVAVKTALAQIVENVRSIFKNYFPIQNLLKILPSKSSVEMSPVILPK
jgi:hypothetical protein